MDKLVNQGGGDQNDRSAAHRIDEITRGLDRMNVDMEVQMELQDHCHEAANLLNTFVGSQQSCENDIDCDQGYTYHTDNTTGLHLGNFTTMNHQFDQCQQQQQQQQRHQPLQENRQQQNSSSILIVTNVDSAVFSDKLIQAKFESLFSAYDANVTFRYLKSFRRVRLDFTSSQRAELARTNLNSYRLGNSQFKCYAAQIIKANNNNQSQDAMDVNSTHLNIPKLTKQFLISPPASPPVGWEPVSENSPCIDVQLISAIANLVPGQTHEIHAGNESQPGIYVEVCEDVQFNDGHHTNQTMRTCSRIPPTMSPASFSQTTT